MGFRFNRRVSVLPGLRINFGKTGASVSVGRRGAWLTFGRRGTRATVGLSGTGLSYTKTFNASSPPTPPVVGRVIPVWVWICAVFLFAWGMGKLLHA